MQCNEGNGDGWVEGEKVIMGSVEERDYFYFVLFMDFEVDALLRWFGERDSCLVGDVWNFCQSRHVCMD